MKPPKIHKKRYATIGDLKSVLSPAVYRQYRPTDRAIDVLTGPIESFTNLPARMLHYLYNKKEPVTYEELSRAAMPEYDGKHIVKVLNEWLPASLMVASWYDGRVRYYQWIEQTEDEHKHRVDDHAWFDALPG